MLTGFSKKKLGLNGQEIFWLEDLFDPATFAKLSVYFIRVLLGV